jgi:hypothetical protein
LAIGINTVLAEGRWQRNYERIYKLWSAGRLPHVFWFSDGEVNSPPAPGPHIRRIPVPEWQERWVTMLQHLWDAVGEAGVRSQVQWYLSIDDDTYLFVENLLDVLGTHDPALPWYLGNESEDLTIAEQLTRMGMGGGGVALSAPLVRHLAGSEHDHSLTACLARYRSDFGGDKKLALCVADVGGLFSREEGFHQLDLKGDYSGLLQHLVSRQPVVSLHHMYVSPPVFHATEPAASTPGEAIRSDLVLSAMDQLFQSYRAHIPLIGADAFMALQFGYLTSLHLTAAINLGYSIRLHEGPPKPASHFKKLVPATADVWDPTARAGKSALSGVAYDARPADDPCTYTTYEWRAPLAATSRGDIESQVAAVAAVPVPGSLLHALLEAGAPQERIGGLAFYHAVPKAAQGCTKPAETARTPIAVKRIAVAYQRCNPSLAASWQMRASVMLIAHSEGGKAAAGESPAASAVLTDLAADMVLLVQACRAHPLQSYPAEWR